MEYLLHAGLQCQYRHGLRHPIRHIRDAENPRPAFLRYLHRPDRAREMRSRRHAIPQLVEVVFQVLLVLFDRHTVSPGRSAILLHFQPRIPHHALGDIIRLALRLRFTHAIPPFRLITLAYQDGPAPWLHPYCDTQGLHSYYGRVRQRAPRRYSAPRGFRRLEFSLSPPSKPAAVSGHTFTCSMRKPEPGSCCLYAGHRLGSKRVTPRLIPGP